MENIMKKTSLFIILAFLGFITFAGTASAIELGKNISIYDGQGAGTGWYGAQEDNEITNGCETGQKWDLEGFYQNGYTLSLVGGFNFKTGEVGSGIRYRSGDLFIDIDGNAQYGSSAAGSQHAIDYNYEYVLDIDWVNNRYNIYDISELTSSLSLVAFTQNNVSNPYGYTPHSNDGAGLLSSGSLFTCGVLAAADNVDNLRGDSSSATHYVATFDLSFLKSIIGP